LEDDEVSRLLEACSSTGTSIARSRNVAIVALLRTSGMRSCELVSLELKDWDREKDTLTLRDTKNGSTHTVFLHPEAKTYLSAWVRVRGDRDGALFTNLNAVEPAGISTFSLRYMVRTRAEAAGIRKFGIHDFRRTFATELLRTHDHSLVSKLLNHRKLSSTLIYDLAEDDLQRAAVAGIALPSVGGTRDGICGTDLDLGDEYEGATK